MKLKDYKRSPSITWDKESTSNMIRISFLNTRSMVNKFDNITSDLSLQQSDVIVLAETWIPENSKVKYRIEKYDTHLNNGDRGKGLAIFSKSDFDVISDLNEENINITKIESNDLDIIAIYRSKDGSLKSLVDKLKKAIDLSKSTLVIGDMNICNKKHPRNELKTFLEDNKFSARKRSPA